MDIVQHRKGLARTRKALKSGRVTIGYIGGSISDARTGYTWPEMVTRWFCERFPGVRVQEENAAIGATGSDLAVFRAQRDLIAPDCDLVFIEFAVNDGGEPTEKRRKTREGLIRKLLQGKGRDIALAYTFGQDMYADMTAGRVPPSIREFEELGQHYGLGSVWMGLHALEEVRRGRMKWEEWLPDGLHPQHRGSYSYAQAVIGFLEKELGASPSRGGVAVGKQMVKPMDPRNWESAAILPFDGVALAGPWMLRRWPYYRWIDQALESSAPGATLSFSFTGTGLVLACDFGKTSAEFRYRIDGGPWQLSNRDRPAWCGNEGWFRTSLLAADLPNRRHGVEVKVIHGNQPDCMGTNFRLGFIGIIRS